MSTQFINVFAYLQSLWSLKSSQHFFCINLGSSLFYYNNGKSGVLLIIFCQGCLVAFLLNLLCCGFWLQISAVDSSYQRKERLKERRWESEALFFLQVVQTLSFSAIIRLWMWTVYLVSSRTLSTAVIIVLLKRVTSSVGVIFSTATDIRRSNLIFPEAEE